MINKKNILLIYAINLILTEIYSYCFIGNLSVEVLLDFFGKEGLTEYFLVDVLQYNIASKNLDIFSGMKMITEGSSFLHSIILESLFSSDSLHISIIVNSALVALMFFGGNPSNRNVKIYLMLSPFLIFYSIGWTKEIILALSFVLLFRVIIENQSILRRFWPYLLCVLSRPQFLPILMLAYFFRNKSLKILLIFSFSILATSPFWLGFVPSAYNDAASRFYEDNGGQGITIYTDYLKTEIPLFSVVGYIFALLKLYYEPFSGDILGLSLYAFVQIYVELIFIYALIKNFSEVIKYKEIVSLIIFYNIFVASLPFTHFRYLLPLMISVIFFFSSKNYKTDKL
jgi:hypothetical protein